MSQPRRAAAAVSAGGSAAPRRGRMGMPPPRSSRAMAVARRLVVPVLAVALVSGGAVWLLAPDTPDTAVPAPSPDVKLGTARSLGRTPLPIEPVAEEVSAGPSATRSGTVEVLPTVSPATDPAPAPGTTPPPTATQPTTPTTPSYPTNLAAAAGTRYAGSSLNVRKGPGVGYSVLDTLAAGAAVSITEATHDGWRQVNLDGRPGWVNASYLVKTKPTTSGTTGQSSTDGLDTSKCSRAAGAEDGLTERTVKVLRAVCNAFPSIKNFGGAREGGGSYHNSGRAVDVMISGDAGWAVAKWARSNASALGIVEVLYSQKIWTTQRSGEGWRTFADRGSDTANHFDHVHISVR